MSEIKKDVTKKPKVAPGMVLVQAVKSGFRGGVEIEPNEIFAIPLEPINPRTGYPLKYSNHEERISAGKHGWMKPFDAEEAKKLEDGRAAYEKRTSPLPPPPVKK